MSEIGNYFMVVTDIDGQLDRTFRDINDAINRNCLVVLKVDNEGTTYSMFLTSITPASFAVEFGNVGFEAADIDGYPARDIGT